MLISKSKLERLDLELKGIEEVLLNYESAHSASDLIEITDSDYDSIIKKFDEIISCFTEALKQ